MPRIRECHDDLFERELSSRVIGAFYDVYNALGYGFLESVYRKALALELTRRGFHVAVEVPAEVVYDGEVVGIFKADILVESRVVLELKASRQLTPADEMQVLNYLRSTDLALGLLFHFGPKPAFRRFVSTHPPRRRSDSRPSVSSAPSASPSPRHRDTPSLTAAPPPSRDPGPVRRPAACPIP